MANHFRKGQKIGWRWGANTAHGSIAERFERRVRRTIEGARVVRAGMKDNPVYLVEQADGGRVLKRGSELDAD